MKRFCKPHLTQPNIKSGASWLSVLLIILIPKCPFCVMAYSGAITMCGTYSLQFSDNHWISFVPLALAALIILMILLNYRGLRTFWAFALSLLGFLLVLGSHQLIVRPFYYQVGTGLLFFSILLNGSLFSLLKKLRETFTGLLKFKKSKANQIHNKKIFTSFSQIFTL